MSITGRLDRQPAALLERWTVRPPSLAHVGLAGLDEACLGGVCRPCRTRSRAMSCLIAEKRGSQPPPAGPDSSNSHGELARHAGGPCPQRIASGRSGPKAALGERVFQAGDVAVHQGLDVRVRGRSWCPLVLAQLGHDLARERTPRAPGTRAARDPSPLARGPVLVRMEEADARASTPRVTRSATSRRTWSSRSA